MLTAAVVAAVAVACVSEPAPAPRAPPDAGTPTGAPADAQATGAPPTSCAAPCRDAPRVVGRFDPVHAPEASGIAASRRNPGLLYIVDDGPGPVSLLVVSQRDADVIGRVAVDAPDAVDVEDVAVAACRRGGTATCVYVADIGDNVRARPSVAVLRIAEPDLSAGVPSSPLRAQRMELRFPDGPVDAETLLATDDGTFGIVTKHPGRRGRGGARLYVTDGFSHGTLQRAGRIRLPRPPVPTASALLGLVVTGGDAVPGAVALRTYDAVYELRGDGPLRRATSWSARVVAQPDELQGEAVAYTADGCGMVTVGEGSGRLTVIPCQSSAAVSAPATDG